MVFSLRLFPIPDKKVLPSLNLGESIMKIFLMILSLLVSAPSFAASKDVPQPNTAVTAAPETEEAAIDATAEAIAKLQTLQEQTRKIAAERARVKNEIAASRERLADLQKQLSELQSGLETEQANRSAKEDQLEKTALSAETKQKIDALVEQVREISVPATPDNSAAAPSKGSAATNTSTARNESAQSNAATKETAKPAATPKKAEIVEIVDKEELRKHATVQPSRAHEEASEDDTYDETAVDEEDDDTMSHFSAGLRVSVVDGGTDVTLNTPAGFAVNSSSSTQPELWVSWREDKVVLELSLVPGDTAEYDLQFFGTSLGKATVTGPQVGVSASYIVYEKSWMKATLGVGFEQFEVDSTIGMGGVPFTVTGDGWHAVGKLGAEFPIHQSNFSITTDIVLDDTEIKIAIPGGGGDVIIKGKNPVSLLIGGVYHF